MLRTKPSIIVTVIDCWYCWCRGWKIKEIIRLGEKGSNFINKNKYQKLPSLSWNGISIKFTKHINSTEQQHHNEGYHHHIPHIKSEMILHIDWRYRTIRKVVNLWTRRGFRPKDMMFHKPTKVQEFHKGVEPIVLLIYQECHQTFVIVPFLGTMVHTHPLNDQRPSDINVQLVREQTPKVKATIFKFLFILLIFKVVLHNVRTVISSWVHDSFKHGTLAGVRLYVKDSVGGEERQSRCAMLGEPYSEEGIDTGQIPFKVRATVECCVEICYVVES